MLEERNESQADSVCASPDEQLVMVAESITSGDLILTPLQAVDADAMFVVLQDRELYSFTGGEPATIDALRARYARQAGGVSPDGSQLWLNWIIRMSDEPVGYVQATVAPRQGRVVAELAWVIGTQWQGRGLATRSALMMQTWLRDRGVDRFTASIHPQHAASASVAVWLGLQPSGESTDEGECIWRLP
ncbi:RimJ/RimL family protein N-acetyltransferase [Microbacterium sp. SORGH_AS428]|uniref:GNAT family N-acetyltransferase n=1 Tax=Microbacterium sp. SORGH_AS_0428 TaxID=3041788 RepID=UPI00285E29AD|nr:GNAT family N-acetyltransferase [Microbacterium sp. SORGH_AS_0428]MDR6200783.1 RimJ/RimL family protein N-acetyltransferase [Microbacterium sp. SORGH_AS_0428]